MAKLLQLIRITNADAPYCGANGTNAMLAAVFLYFNHSPLF